VEDAEEMREFKEPSSGDWREGMMIRTASRYGSPFGVYDTAVAYASVAGIRSYMTDTGVGGVGEEEGEEREEGNEGEGEGGEGEGGGREEEER